MCVQTSFKAEKEKSESVDFVLFILALTIKREKSFYRVNSCQALRKLWFCNKLSLRMAEGVISGSFKS